MDAEDVVVPCKKEKVGKQGKKAAGGRKQVAMSIQEDFEKTFNSQVEDANGNIFFIADKAMLQKIFRKRFAKQSMYFEDDSEVPTSGEKLLEMFAPGARQHKIAFEERYSKDLASGAPRLADIDHWPKTAGGSFGPEFPCQLCHGMVWSFNENRPAVGPEHFTAQGFHCLPQMQSTFRSRLSKMILSFNEPTAKALSGNGICLPSYAAWVTYVFANTVMLESSKLREEFNMWTKGSSTLFEGEDDLDSKCNVENVESSSDVGSAGGCTDEDFVNPHTSDSSDDCLGDCHSESSECSEDGDGGDTDGQETLSS